MAQSSRMAYGVAAALKAEKDFLRTEGLQLLRLCGKGSSHDRSLARCVDAQPRVIRCIVSQVVYLTRIGAVLKRLCTAARLVPPPGPPQAPTTKRPDRVGAGALGSSAFLRGGKDASSAEHISPPVSPRSDQNINSPRTRGRGGPHSRLVEYLLHALEDVDRQCAGAASPGQPNIAIIGCGQVGSTVLGSLLDGRLYHGTCLTVSTRQPVPQPEHAGRGVRYFHNNVVAAQNADVIILCVLPAQLPEVAGELRGHIPRSCLVISTLAGVSDARISSALDHKACITTSVSVPKVSNFCATLADQQVRRDPLPPHSLGELLRIACPFSVESPFLGTVLQNAVDAAAQRGVAGAQALVVGLFAVFPARVSVAMAASVPWQVSAALGGAAAAADTRGGPAKPKLPPPLWWGGVDYIVKLCGSKAFLQDVTEAASEHFTVIAGCPMEHVEYSRLPITQSP
eukprot:Hpha_TRINITY_DN2532_c0_g1::TRINITY_DN2532_c0_g1_i1::g.1283::m.1283